MEISTLAIVSFRAWGLKRSVLAAHKLQLQVAFVSQKQ